MGLIIKMLSRDPLCKRLVHPSDRQTDTEIRIRLREVDHLAKFELIRIVWLNPHFARLWLLMLLLSIFYDGSPLKKKQRFTQAKIPKNDTFDDIFEHLRSYGVPPLNQCMKLIYWYKIELFSLHEYIEIICFELNKKENRKKRVIWCLFCACRVSRCDPSQPMFHDIA